MLTINIPNFLYIYILEGIKKKKLNIELEEKSYIYTLKTEYLILYNLLIRVS